MINRRKFNQGALALAGLGFSAAGLQTARAATELNDDGLHVQPWFLDSFLDMGDDLNEAKEQGKRLAIIWEQRGCPYCREMHNVNFADARISEYIQENFVVLQMNLWGAREVTDFDGKAMEERSMARRWGVNFTPTIMFLGDEALNDRSAKAQEVARMPGYFKPFHFMSMFEFVSLKAYEKQGFQKFLQDKFARLKAEGKDPTVW